MGIPLSGRVRNRWIFVRQPGGVESVTGLKSSKMSFSTLSGSVDMVGKALALFLAGNVKLFDRRDNY
ncbi:MAG: hypothetical protein AB1717_08080 [Pseudomonadota bacterium]